MPPKVSVVIGFLNGDNFIREAIASVKAQTLTDWELILVDDGSTDGSAALAAELARRDERVRYVTHPGRANHGLAASRVLGSDQASGEYLLFLDHDDVLDGDALQRLAGLLDSQVRAAAVFAATRFWTWRPDEPLQKRNQSYRPLRTGLVRGAAFRRYLLKDGEHPHVCSMMFRRAEMLAARDSAETWHGMYEDTALIMKLIARHDIYLLDKPVSNYRITPTSMSFTAPRDYAAFLRWAARRIPMDPLSHLLLRRRILLLQAGKYLSKLKKLAFAATKAG